MKKLENRLKKAINLIKEGHVKKLSPAAAQVTSSKGLVYFCVKDDREEDYDYFSCNCLWGLHTNKDNGPCSHALAAQFICEDHWGK